MYYVRGNKFCDADDVLQASKRWLRHRWHYTRRSCTPDELVIFVYTETHYYYYRLQHKSRELACVPVPASVSTVCVWRTLLPSSSSSALYCRALAVWVPAGRNVKNAFIRPSRLLNSIKRIGRNWKKVKHL